MILLRNFDYANKYFDYVTKVEMENNKVDKINGWYKFINGILVALLVLDNKLYYLYDSDKYLLTNNFKVVLEKNDLLNKCVFNIFDNQKKLISYSYNLPDQTINITPFEYIDDEDFKWEEFVEKIINNDSRRNDFIVAMGNGG